MRRQHSNLHLELFMKYGIKVRKYRQRNGYSQLELECLCDFASGMISRIENLNINPTKETLIKIAKALRLENSEVIDLFCLSEV